MRAAELGGVVWSTCSYLSLDGGSVAIGDRRCVALVLARPDDGVACLPNGIGMAICRAGGDYDDLPVEIAALRGRVIGSRIEFTNDVAELADRKDGKWQAIGECRIGRLEAIACDPACAPDPYYVRRLPLGPGLYRAQTFRWQGDVLGLRLVAVLQASRLASGVLHVS